MRRITRDCSFLAGFLLLAAAAFSEQPAQSPTPVGKYGHPAKLIVRGAEKIPAGVVKQRLLADPEVLLAGHCDRSIDIASAEPTAAIGTTKGAAWATWRTTTCTPWPTSLAAI